MATLYNAHMAKWLMIAACTFAGVVAGVVALQNIPPPTRAVERRLAIAAPPALVFAELNNLHRWLAWSPWGVRGDPQVKTAFDGPPAGVGAKATWAGNDAVGEGSLEIDTSRPPALLGLTLITGRPEHEEFASTLSLQSIMDANSHFPSTVVTWQLRGTRTAMSRIALWLSNLEGEWGRPMEGALAALQQVCEEKLRERTPVDTLGTPGAPVISVLREEKGGCGWWRLQGSGRRSLGHFDLACKEVVSLTVHPDQEQGLALVGLNQAPAAYTMAFRDGVTEPLPVFTMHRGEAALALQYTAEDHLPTLLTWAPAPPEDQPGGDLKVGKWRRYVLTARGWQLDSTLVESPEDLQGDAAGAAQAEFFAKDTWVRQIDLDAATQRGEALGKELPKNTPICADANSTLIAFDSDTEGANPGSVALCVAAPDGEGFLRSTGEGALVANGKPTHPFSQPGMGRSLLRFWNFQIQGRYVLTCRHGASAWDLGANAALPPLPESEGVMVALWPYDKCLE